MSRLDGVMSGPRTAIINDSLPLPLSDFVFTEIEIFGDGYLVLRPFLRGTICPISVSGEPIVKVPELIRNHLDTVVGVGPSGAGG